MSEVGLILGMFIITFSIRFVMFAFAGKMSFPPWLEIALKFVPPTVLTAIIIPTLVMPEGFIDIDWHNYHLVSGIFTFIIALKTNKLIATISLGMCLFFTLKFLSL